MSRLLRVRAPAGNFRRAGLAFGKEVVELDPDDLSGVQLFALTNEPRLEVEGSLDGETFSMVAPMDEETLAALEANREAAQAAKDAAASQGHGETADEVDKRLGGAGEGDEADQAPSTPATDVSDAIDSGASEQQLAAAGVDQAGATADTPTEPVPNDAGGGQSPADVSAAIDPAASPEQKAAAGAPETTAVAEASADKPKGRARSPRS